MGATLEELGQRMTAQEFALHYELHLGEPIEAPMHLALGTLMAAIANGTLKVPAGRLWQATDFVHTPWVDAAESVAAEPAQPSTVDEIMARVRAAGG